MNAGGSYVLGNYTIQEDIRHAPTRGCVSVLEIVCDSGVESHSRRRVMKGHKAEDNK